LLGVEGVVGAGLAQAQASPIAKMTIKDKYILALSDMLMLFYESPYYEFACSSMSAACS